MSARGRELKQNKRAVQKKLPLPVNPQRFSIASSDDALLVTVGRTQSAEAVRIEGEAVPHTEPEVVAMSCTVARVSNIDPVTDGIFTL